MRLAIISQRLANLPARGLPILTALVDTGNAFRKWTRNTESHWHTCGSRQPRGRSGTDKAQSRLKCKWRPNKKKQLRVLPHGRRVFGNKVKFSRDQNWSSWGYQFWLHLKILGTYSEKGQRTLRVIGIHADLCNHKEDQALKKYGESTQM